MSWDQRLLEIFDKDPEQFTSRFDDWRSAVHPEDVEEAESAFFKSIEAQDYFKHTFRIKTDDGEIKYLLGMASATYDKTGQAH